MGNVVNVIRDSFMNLIKPKKLSAGDTVAIVSSSWGGPGTFPHRYEAGKRQLSEVFGVNVVEMPHALKSPEWVKNNPKARAEDLMQAFEDSSVSAIFSSIGGDDSIRMLPYMDLNIIQRNPKIFMGYSDTTVTHFMCLKAGLSSFYGPSIMAGFAENAGLFPFMEDSVRKTLFSTSPVGLIPEDKEWTVQMLEWGDPSNQSIARECQTSMGRRLLQGTGVVEGHLIGGCIDVFPMLIGQSIWPEKASFKNAILFLETSEDVPTVADFKYILRNMGVQGILEELNGIILGRPGGQLPLDKLTQYDEALQEVVRDEFGLSELPLMTQMDFGHTDPMFVLPYGALAKIDCEKRQFLIPEPCVI
jgi:muramoyltetrapeptide carboxypeptidase LdcA involved in peptidoglycan recycling